MVEADETYVGGKEENKHASKRTTGTHGRSTKTKTAVLGMVERGGEVRATRLSTAEAEEIEAHIRANVKPGSVVMTDEFKGYAKLGRTYLHFTVNHKQGEYVSGEFCHTNTIENFWSLFKRAVIGIYHHVSDKHINRYLDMAAFRYGNRMEGEGARVNHLLAEVSGKRLKYKELIA